ncbi:Ig-like domain-containing protein [Pantoea agglomerans]
MTTPLNLLVVDGKTVVKTASLPQAAKGQPVHIKAIDGGKYLLSSGENHTAPDHIVVKRVGKDLQVFTQDGDDTPEIIIDGFYDHQGELSGMTADGTYHTYVNQDGSDRDAFLLLDDSGASTLILGSDSTAGLEGLAAAGGLSNGMIALGALAALAALTGIAIAAHNRGGHDHHVADPKVPGVTSATDNVGSVQGKIAQHGVTDDSRPVFDGKGTPNSIINVYDNGTLIGSTVVAADGSWAFQPTTPLPEGAHDISFSETNSAGVESPQSAPVSFDVDLPPPAAADIISVTDGKDQDLIHGGLTNNGDVEMFGKDATPGDVVKMYDGDKLIGSTVVDADGNWTVPGTIVGDGEHDLTIGITDPAGNESPRSPAIPVDLDTTAPDAPTPTLADGNGLDLTHGGLTNNGDMDMSGNGAAPGDVVKLYDGDKLIGSAVVDDSGNWTIPGAISGDGKHDLSASITDPAGNESARSAPIAVDLDTTAPDAPTPTLEDGNGLDLTAGGLTNNGDMDMSGSGANPGDVVKLYDGDTLIGSAIVDESGNWTVPGAISGDGPHDLSATATDPAGNESAKSAPIKVDLDTTAPDAPTPTLADGNGLDLTAGGLTNNGSLDMSGKDATPGDVVKLYDGDTLIGSAVVDASGNWTVPGGITGDTTHPISATITDPAGNESARSAPINVDLDTVAPAAPSPKLADGNGLDLTAGGTTNNGHLDMSGSGGTPKDVVKLYDGNTLIGSAVVDASGNWTVPGVISGDSTHPITATATDLAGNESAHSAPIPVALDTTAPTTTLNLDDNNPTLSGVTEANAVVFIYDGTTLLGSQKANASGNWSWKPSAALADGTYNYNATAQDALGNTSAHTSNLPFNVVTTISDFNDTTGQGWALSSEWATRSAFTGTNVTLRGSGNDSGEIMHRGYQVVAGHTYTISFTTIGIYSGGSPSPYFPIGVEVDNVLISPLQGMSDGKHTFTFTADHTGNIDLSLISGTSDFTGGGSLLLDNFNFRDAGPTGATSVSSFGVQSDESAHDDAISSISAHHDDSSAAVQQTESTPAPVQHDDGANHFQLSGNELKMIDTGTVIDLSNVAQQHQGEEIHSLSLEGHGNNVLNVNINDVLALGSEDLFQQDGNKQLMIKGDAGDTVNLESVNGDKSPEQWNAQGQVSHDGTTFNVYQNVDHDVEVLIQQGIQTHVQ